MVIAITQNAHYTNDLEPNYLQSKDNFKAPQPEDSYGCSTDIWCTPIKVGTFKEFQGAEFLVLFSSRSCSLALKLSLKSHQMTTFFVQKRSLSEIIIIWVKTLSFWTKQVAIWWLFNDHLRARELEREEKGTTNYVPKSNTIQFLDSHFYLTFCLTQQCPKIKTFPGKVYLLKLY